MKPPTIAVVPPVLGAHLLDPLERRVPVVVDVVVVEDHRAGHGREQPADRRLAPRLAVELRVLLEVGDPLVRRLGGVASLRMYSSVRGGPRRRRPGRRAAAARAATRSGRRSRHPQRDRAQRVDLAARRVLVLAQRVAAARAARRRGRSRTRSAPGPRLRVRAQRRSAGTGCRAPATPARRRARPRTASRASRREPADVHERVVVALDRERALARAPRRPSGRTSTAQRLVGLDPHRRLVDVPA